MEQPEAFVSYSTGPQDDGLGGLDYGATGVQQEAGGGEDDGFYGLFTEDDEQPPAKKQRRQTPASQDDDGEYGQGYGDDDDDDDGTWQDTQADEPPEEEEEQPQGQLPDVDLMKAKFDAMTELQRNRYEEYRRSTLPKARMKKLIEELTGQKSNEKVIIALNAITKLFLGDVVERARVIAAYQGHTGALLPTHLRQAYRQLDNERKVPHRGPAKPLQL